MPKTEAQMLQILADHDYGVYNVVDPKGTLAIADPLGGEDGFYLIGNSISELFNEIVEHELFPVSD